MRISLMANAVTAALPAQGTPQGYYNIERRVKSVISFAHSGPPMKRIPLGY
jgi:uncharacterized protein involved in oxidation of intracellular sulfur